MSDLQSLGAMLQQARESSGMSLEEVEAETRIRVKFLQALESGDLGVLPSTAHAKGFLRNYAQYLRLDADTIIAQFSSLTGGGTPRVTTSTASPIFTSPAPPQGAPLEPAFDQQEPPQPAEPPPPFIPPYSPGQPPPQQRTRSSYVTPDRRVGPGTPLGISGQPPLTRPAAPSYPSVSGTGPLSTPQVVEQERPNTPLHRLVQSNLFITGVLALGIIGIVVWVVGQLSSVSGQELATAGQSTEFLVEGSPAVAVPSITVEPTLDTTGTPSSGIPSFIAADRVSLSITVTERTWARVTVDGETQFEGQVVKGTVLQYQGQEIIVVVGNAIAFDVTFNGQPLGPMGARGKIVERIFTPTGYITPTPTPTITPTNTLVPTATPRGPTPTPTRKP